MRPRFIRPNGRAPCPHPAYWNAVVAQYLAQPLPAELTASVYQRDLENAQLLRARARAFRALQKRRASQHTIRTTLSRLRRNAAP